MSRARSLVPLFMLGALAACSETPTNLSERDAAPQSTAGDAVKFWEVLSSVDWNARANDLAALRVADQGRLFAYLSMAQYLAAEAALERRPNSPVGAAIGGASAAVLATFFPLDVMWIEAELDADQARQPWPGAKRADVAAGEALGRTVAAQVLAWAAGDRLGLTNPGTPPVGPGYWVSGGVIARGHLGARSFFLDSNDEFRPPPPPPFGSAAFLQALAEVRQISDTRTGAQAANAVFWHVNQSPRMNTVMNAKARELIVKYHRRDEEAARILFLANASVFDALNACFDAKYHYWLLRPTMADPAITIPVGIALPPHPSYPSAHSCISGAITEVLALAFPPEREELEALAWEAGFSRVLGGIHYSFDSVVGLELGAAVARKAWRSDLGDIDITP